MLGQKLLGAAIAETLAGTFTFLSTAPVYTSSGTSAVMTYPAGIQAGDLLFIIGLIQSGTAFGAITGWTSQGGAGSYGSCLTKTAVGTESGGTVTVTWGTTAAAVHVLGVVRHSSSVTPSLFYAAGVSTANPSLTLAPAPVEYTQLAHLVNYVDNAALSMSSLNANLTVLQYRTTSYGLWIGWINTSTLNMVNSVITSSSAGLTISGRLFTVYV